MKKEEQTSRTEEQIVARAPIVVILGGKEYEIAPLVIKDSLPWKRKVAQSVAPLPNLIGITMDNPKEFGETLSHLLVDGPEEVLNLFFDYAKDLDRGEIESIATESEVAVAFGKVVEAAFGPLAQSLLGVMKRLSR